MARVARWLAGQPVSSLYPPLLQPQAFGYTPNSTIVHLPYLLENINSISLLKTGLIVINPIFHHKWLGQSGSQPVSTLY